MKVILRKLYTRRNQLRIIAFIHGIPVGIAGYFALTSSPNGAASGWWQVVILIIGLPILLYQLYEILRELGKKPELDIGLATINDLPTSRIREKKTLPYAVDVSSGYPHFFLVIKNQGKAAARYIKVHFEHRTSETPLNISIKRPPPVLKVSEFSKEKPQFHQENNVECVFTGGTNWVIHPEDTEVFGFHMTTSVIKETIKRENGDIINIPESPARGDCVFDCTIWTEGVDKPISKRLIVGIVDDLISKDYDD